MIWDFLQQRNCLDKHLTSKVYVEALSALNGWEPDPGLTALDALEDEVCRDK